MRLFRKVNSSCGIRRILVSGKDKKRFWDCIEDGILRVYVFGFVAMSRVKVWSLLFIVG